jgi:hypothetical protein
MFLAVTSSLSSLAAENGTENLTLCRARMPTVWSILLIQKISRMGQRNDKSAERITRDGDRFALQNRSEGVKPL